MKENKKLRNGFTLIEILIVIGIISILATIVIVAINPARQFAQARNTQRLSNINAILNSIGQYMADNKGILPSQINSTASNIGDGSGQIDLCALLVPDYMPVLTSEPTLTTGAMEDSQITRSECDSGQYDTGYTVMKDSNSRITISAPLAELNQSISITR